MTKKETIKNGVMRNATLSYGDTMIVSATNFAVTQSVKFENVQYSIYSYCINVATLTLFNPCEVNRLILKIEKDARWSNTTKKDVNLAIEAILEKFECPAKVVIYTKKGKVGALCDMPHDIKIELE